MQNIAKTYHNFYLCFHCFNDFALSKFIISLNNFSQVQTKWYNITSLKQVKLSMVWILFVKCLLINYFRIPLVV